MKRLIAMGALALSALLLAFAGPARASHPSQVLRVERPSKGQGAHITTVRVISGRVGRRIRARVLTDARCNPDAMGVSHCLNRMQLGNGMTITVVHDHRMMDMPCLSPGEQVILSPK